MRNESLPPPEPGGAAFVVIAMPLYEYICKRCKREFELLVRNRETPTCPACGARELDKKISSFSAASDAPKTPCGDRGGHACCGGHCHHGHCHG